MNVIAPLVVSQQTGNDATASRYGSPYATLSAAKAAAQSGDTTIVTDGTFAENDLIADGVNWMFLPGTIIDYTANGSGDVAGNRGIFDDRSGSVTCRIVMLGTIKYAFNNDMNCNGAVVLKHGTSRVYFECPRIEIDNGSISQAALYIKACSSFTPNIDAIVKKSDPDSMQPTGSQSGLYWEKGYVRGAINHVAVGGAAVKTSEPAGNPNTRLLLRGHYWGSFGAAISHTGINSNYRVSLQCSEIFGGSGVEAAGGGKLIVDAQRIHGDGEAVLLEGGVNAEISTQLMTNGFDNYEAIVLWPTFSGNAVIRFTSLEDSGGNSLGIANLAGSGRVIIHGVRASVTNGRGITVNGTGNFHIIGLSVVTRTTNGPGNNPIILGAHYTNNTLILDRCKLIAPASATSIASKSTRQVINYGSVANRAPGAKVKVQAPLVVRATVV